MNQSENLYTLGGRPYRLLEVGTLEHLIWMDELTKASGLKSSLLGPIPATPAGAGDFAGKVWDLLSASGLVFDFLAGMLIPAELKDEDWTPAMAQESAARFRKLTDRGDHARIQSILIALVIGFFEAALPWRNLSASVSASEEGAERQAERTTGAEPSSAISASGAP